MLNLPAPPRHSPEFGHDALVVCDNLVRIYQSESVEVQALQGLDLLVDGARWSRSSEPPGRASRPCSTCSPAWTSPTAGRARVAVET